MMAQTQLGPFNTKFTHKFVSHSLILQRHVILVKCGSFIST